MFWPKNVLKSRVFTQKRPQITLFHPITRHFYKTTLYLFTENSTFLARLLGVWSIKIYEDEKKIEASTYILMENVFCGLDMIRKFDLKGSTRNRRALSNSIIWDSDYIEHEEIFRPLQTFDFCKEKMMSQLKKDVEFLKRYRVFFFLKCRILGWNTVIWGRFWVKTRDFRTFFGQKMQF